MEASLETQYPTQSERVHMESSLGLGYYPNCSNLVKNRVPIPLNCPRCGESETTIHVLWDCWLSRANWTKVDADLTKPQTPTFRWDWVSSSCSRHQREELAILASQLWAARNEYNFDKIHTPQQACIRRALV